MRADVCRIQIQILAGVVQILHTAETSIEIHRHVCKYSI